jgi:hypothetical protein
MTEGGGDRDGPRSPPKYGKNKKSYKKKKNVKFGF